MTLAIETHLMTVAEFTARPDVRNFELIDGNLVERNVGTRSSYIAVRIIRLIEAFAERSNLGWTLGADTVYQCFGSRHTGRKMDVSFVRRGRLPGERIPDGHMSIAPDLAVEVVSPNDLAYMVHDKVSLYLKAGVKLVWLVYPETRSIEVKRPDRSGGLFFDDQEITGESVLPGFTAPVSSFFPPMENVETAPTPVE